MAFIKFGLVLVILAVVLEIWDELPLPYWCWWNTNRWGLLLLNAAAVCFCLSIITNL